MQPANEHLPEHHARYSVSECVTLCCTGIFRRRFHDELRRLRLLAGAKPMRTRPLDRIAVSPRRRAGAVGYFIVPSHAADTALVCTKGRHEKPHEESSMKRYISLVAMAAALASMQLVVEPASAKKMQPQTQTAQTSTNKCPGGVSRGCGPGSCQCP